MASTLRQSNFHGGRDSGPTDEIYTGITPFNLTDYRIEQNLEKLKLELLARLSPSTQISSMSPQELDAFLLPDNIYRLYLQTDSTQKAIESEYQRIRNMLEYVFEEALKKIILLFERTKKDLFEELESEKVGLFQDQHSFRMEVGDYLASSRRMLQSHETKSYGNIRDSLQAMKRTMDYGSYSKFDTQKQSQEINRILKVINEMFINSAIIALSKKVNLSLQSLSNDRSSTQIKNVTTKIDLILSDIKSNLDELTFKEQAASDLKQEIVSPIPDYMMNNDKQTFGLTISREANVSNQINSGDQENINFTTSAKNKSPVSQTEIDKQFSILEQNLNSINPRSLVNNSPTSKKDVDALRKSFFRSQNSITSGTVNNLNESRKELPHLPKDSVKSFMPKSSIANSLPIPNMVASHNLSSNNTDKKINKFATKTSGTKLLHGSTRTNTNEQGSSSSLVNKHLSFKHSFRTLTDFIPMQNLKESQRIGASPKTSRQNSDRFSLSNATPVPSKPQSRVNPLSSTNLDFSYSLGDADDSRTDTVLVSSSKTSVVSKVSITPHRYSISKIFSDEHSHITCIETDENQCVVFAGNVRGELVKIQLDQSRSKSSSVQKLWFNKPIKNIHSVSRKYLLIQANSSEKSLFLIDTTAFGIVKNYQIPAERIKSIAYFTNDYFFVITEANKLYLFSLDSSLPKRTFFISGPIITDSLMSSPTAVFVSNIADEVKMLKFSPESLSIDLLVS